MKRDRDAVLPGVAVAVAVIFAALDEYHQGWIPGRDPDVGDWLADILGIIVGFWIGSHRRRERGAPPAPPENDARGIVPS